MIATICTALMITIAGPNGPMQVPGGVTCTTSDTPTSVCTQSVTTIKAGRVDHVCTKYGPPPAAG